MAYRLRVIGLALLGYGYLLGLLALPALILLGGAIGLLREGVTKDSVEGLLFGGVLLNFFLRTLAKVRARQPDGLELSREDAPRLFDLIDDTRRSLGSPVLHKVWVTGELNAAVSQVPRFGPFGPTVNHLQLGMPLLDALSPEQFRAALAHEFGHLAGSHGRLGPWVRRLRATWNSLSHATDGPESGDLGFVDRKMLQVAVDPFFRWHAPRFEARSLELVRRQELDADDDAAKLAGKEAMAGCLLRSEIAGRYLDEEFWPELDRLASASPDPPADAFGLLRQRLANPTALAGRLELWLSEALGTPDDPGDSHPALARRLRAIGWSGSTGEAARPPAAGAAEALLGESAGRLRAELGRRWAERRQADWRKRHVAGQARLARLEALRSKAAEGPLELQEAWTLYRGTKELSGPTAAVALLKDLLTRWPADARIAFEAGCHLLSRGDERGPAWLERASTLDPHLLPAACAHLRVFRRRRGRDLDEGLRRRLREYERRLNAAERERWSTGGAWREHDLPPAQVRRVVIQLESLPGLRRAYLARKEVTSFPEQPFHTLALVPGGLGAFGLPVIPPALVDKLASELPFEGEVRVLTLRQPILQVRLALLGAPAFRRPRSFGDYFVLCGLALLAGWALLVIYALIIA